MHSRRHGHAQKGDAQLAPISKERTAAGAYAMDTCRASRARTCSTTAYAKRTLAGIWMRLPRKSAHLEPVLFLRLLPELELVCLSRFSTATSVLAPQESAYKALAMVALFVSMLAPSVEQPKTSHAAANP